MIFHTLQLKNFRQFPGEQTLHFSTSKERNVTVIYGANGSGKTTLLNAFTWVLYGTTTPAFKHPDDLINHAAWADIGEGEEIETRVSLVFEHDEQTFTIERTTSAKKGAGGEQIRLLDGQAALHITDETGRNSARDNPNKTIREILPEQLHSFFFFDGERIEKLAADDAFSEIEDAVKTILGLKVLERGIRHLEDAGQVLGKEVAEVGSDEDKRLNDELDQIREKDERLAGEAATQTTENRARRNELDRVNAEMSGKQEAHELQERREMLEKERADAIGEIETSKRAIRERISSQGYLAFLEGLANKVEKLVDERRTKGEIPAKIKLQLIQDLLHDGTCICGRELVDGSDAYAKVEGWKREAGDGLAEEGWIKAGAAAAHLYEDRDNLYQYLRETGGELERHQARRRSIDEHLDEIRGKFEGIDSDEIQRLEQRREQLLQDLHLASVRVGEINAEREALKQRRAETEKELDRVETKNEETRLAKKRVAVARRARQSLESAYSERTDEVRSELDERIAREYAKTSYKGYDANLTDDFQLRLTKRVDGIRTDVPRSSGESQILSLSFVGSISDYARELAANRGVGTPDSFAGGIYPIVMDSPFGTLDVAYQERIAEAIPRLSPQVVVLVSKSQGLGAVQDVLLERVGKQAVIRHSTPDASKAEDIELATGTHPFVVHDDGAEWARIEEV